MMITSVRTDIPIKDICEGFKIDPKRAPGALRIVRFSIAEAISVMNNGLALSGYFGDGRINASDLVSGIIGAVVKDPVQDKVVWNEYMETVLKTRDGWKDIYRAARDWGE